MTRGLWLLLAVCPALAHMVSMSTGEARISGARVHYELRMPLYEIAHLRDPEKSLLDNIRFSSDGVDGRLLDKACRADPAEDSYACSATYEFPSPVERLHVECTFHAITVPNHVHLLRASLGGKTDQAVFDLTFTKADIRFAPPTTAEMVLSQGLAGALRAAGGAAPLLFLVALALAARSRRELAALAGALVAGELLACVLAPRLGWQPAPRFVEAAAALTIAYLAAEMLLLPGAGKRWMVVGALGVLHGLNFEMFLRASGYSAVNVLAGAGLAELALAALFGLALLRLRRAVTRKVVFQGAQGLLLAIGAVWFVVRLRG